jgi:hypothetical protein
LKESLKNKISQLREKYVKQDLIEKEERKK